jgi:hypothetical protein
MGNRRGGLIGELALALPPTLVVLGSLFLIEAAQHQRVLFASLASSAFLIYREPLHPMNGVCVMLLAHLVGATVGIGATALLGAGYRASAVAMIITIVVLTSAISSTPPQSLPRSVSLSPTSNAAQAASSLLVAALVFLQRAAVWGMHRFAAHATPRDTGTSSGAEP